jgi:hypothetical protein
LGFTLALWLLSWAIYENHAAYNWNPTWRLILSLRSIFTWGLITGVGILILLIVINEISLSRVRKKGAAIIDANNAARAAYESNTHVLNLQKEAEKIEVARLDILEHEKQYALRIEKEKLEKQTRSASAAVHDALKDF